jgi:DNA-binding NarL/FixJ family response regulator
LFGLIACERGDTTAAAAAFAEAFAQGQAAGEPAPSPGCTAGVAVLAAGCGHPEAAARLLGAAAAHARALGTPFALPKRTAYERATAAARAALGEDRFAAARDAGGRMAPESARAEAIRLVDALSGATEQEATVRTARAAAHGLTARELEVIGLVAAGHSNREIADRLSLSERTVEHHVLHVRTKLDLTSRVAMATYAVTHGLA